MILAQNHTVVTVADGAHRIRKITAAGQVETIAGSDKPGYRDGKGTHARFKGPHGLAVDSKGFIYVADRLNHRIRRIDDGNGRRSDFRELWEWRLGRVRSRR